jgi:hypothetical protein
MTGFTANMMVFGREINKPADIILGTAELTEEERTPSLYVRLLERLMISLEKAYRKHKKGKKDIMIQN